MIAFSRSGNGTEDRTGLIRLLPACIKNASDMEIPDQPFSFAQQDTASNRSSPFHAPSPPLPCRLRDDDFAGLMQGRRVPTPGPEEPQP